MDAKRIKKELRNNRALERCARRFGLVGDPTKLKICWLLSKHPELSVGEMAEIIGVSISAVSHSLRKLRAEKLVRGRREYKQVFYCLSTTPFTHYLRETLTSTKG